jgi:hypothetical protein
MPQCWAADEVGAGEPAAVHSREAELGSATGELDVAAGEYDAGTGRPSLETAAASRADWEGTMSVSTKVKPSSSRTAPAFGRPMPCGFSNQAYTPGASALRDAGDAASGTDTTLEERWPSTTGRSAGAEPRDGSPTVLARPILTVPTASCCERTVSLEAADWRATATSLKLWFEFLDEIEVRWDGAGVEDVARFVDWLRAPADNVVVHDGGKGRRSSSTVNRHLAGVFGFYDHHVRAGVALAADLVAWRRVGRGYYKPFLHHVTNGRRSPSRPSASPPAASPPRSMPSRWCRSWPPAGGCATAPSSACSPRPGCA